MSSRIMHLTNWTNPRCTQSRNPARLYGYNGWTSEFAFRRFTLNPDGIVIQDATSGLLSGYDLGIEFADGLVFASSGVVIQPETRIVVTNIPDISAGALVKPNPATRLQSFLTQKLGNWILRQYAHSNYSLLRKFRVPEVLGDPQSLTRCGTDGLAFLPSSNQLFLLRPPSAVADLAVRHTFWPTDVIARQPFQITLSVTNQGPYAALDVSVTNTLPAWTKRPRHPSCSRNNHHIRRQTHFRAGHNSGQLHGGLVNLAASDECRRNLSYLSSFGLKRFSRSASSGSWTLRLIAGSPTARWTFPCSTCSTIAAALLSAPNSMSENSCAPTSTSHPPPS